MPAADVIFRNASVITMDSRQPAAQVVAITGDAITLVGSNAEADSVTGPETRVIDCGGRAVLPGFNDAHLHLFSLIRKLLSIDLSPVTVHSIADIKEAIRHKAENTPPGTWLSGTDYNEFYLAEKRFPTRWDIDEVAPNHPVVLSHRSLHACILNSLALSLAGIGMETPEPPGCRIERDLVSGEPNGVLYEMLNYIRREVMPPLSQVELDEAVTLADRHFLSLGITSLQEATYKNDLNRWEAIGGFVKSGKLRSRVSMMAGTEFWRKFNEMGLISGAGDNRLRLGPVKVMLTQTTGELNPPPEELYQLALDCHRSGYRLAFHAEEEEVVGAAIGTLEYINGYTSVVGKRHRIEHCAECPPHLLERLKRLGAVIVTQPPFIHYSGERYLATVVASQLPWLYRIRAPLESGVVVAGSSDTPVVPCNPMVGIYAAVTRQAESGQVLLPEETVTPQQALALYTVNAAYTSFEEDVKGSITPGKLADIIVLSDDPTKVPAQQIKDIRVELTVIGGEVVWEG